MDFTDTYVTTTAEGVPLETTLAGLGSRAIALIIDTIIIDVVIALLLLAVLMILGVDGQFSTAPNAQGVTSPSLSSTTTGILVAVLIVAVFLVQIGYFTAFETWNAGRTPGKQVMGIRAVRLDGSMGFMRSAVRNLFRMIDELPVFYLIGIISVLVTKKNQRLGDLAAGTIVVRYRTAADEQRPMSYPPGAGAGMYPPGAGAGMYPPGAGAGMYPPGYPAFGSIRPEAATWDTSAITTSEIFAVQQFLERRASLQPEARNSLAISLATGLSSKLGGNTLYIGQMHPEEVLEQIYLVKTARR